MRPVFEQSVSVVVVEDDARTRSQLVAALSAEPGFALAAEFDRLKPALEWIATHRTDVLLTDLGLPDGSGIELIRACVARHPTTDVMVVTMFGDESSVLASIEAGATGYLLKDSSGPEIGFAMRDLRSGGSPMSPIIARKVLGRLRHEASTARPATGLPEPATRPNLRLGVPAVQLTRRETDTLDLIARGYTYDEAARLMSVSVSTVQTHIRGIYGKLAVNSRSQAVFEAHKLGLLQDGLLRP
jgi:DNA-binding NarL/FixJ family response regulator